MEDSFFFVGQASTSGDTITSISPPPIAYRQAETMSPAMGFIREGRKASEKSPRADRICAVTALIR